MALRLSKISVKKLLTSKRGSASITKLKSGFISERGSASVEFVTLALPLFIPLFLFLNSYNVMSDGESSLRTLARESVRAFVLTPNDETGNRVAAEVVAKGAAVLGYSDELDSGQLTYEISCDQSPCISPDNKITMKFHLKVDEKRTINVSAIEYVSPWV